MLVLSKTNYLFLTSISRKINGKINMLNLLSEMWKVNASHKNTVIERVNSIEKLLLHIILVASVFG